VRIRYLVQVNPNDSQCGAKSQQSRAIQEDVFDSNLEEFL
jgi:hypothetical protein